MMLQRSFVTFSIILACTANASATWVAVESSGAEQPPSTEVSLLTPGCWQVEMQVPGILLESTIHEGDTMTQVRLPSELREETPEVASWPRLTRFIGLLRDGNPGLVVTQQEWINIPAPDRVMAPFDTSGPVFSLTSAQNLGGVALAALIIKPVEYDADQNSLRVLNRATVEIRETGSELPYDRPITETTASLLRPIIPNWDALGLDELVVRGTYLFIVADHTVAQGGIQSLITWRTRKGYRVEVAGPNQISNWTTTGIKAYIQSRYNSANPPLEFVCLVGDGDGSYTIPYYTYYDGTGDWDYARLNGNDLLPDVAIGRICFSDGSSLAKVVNKTVRYERTPAPRNSGTRSDWYRSGCSVGDAGSGISVVQTMRWVRERMVDADYLPSSVDTLYYIYYGGNIPPSAMNAAIDAGSSLWCYRGFGGMNAYEVSHAMALTNYAGHWPFIVTVTCGTNNFFQYSLCEAFLNGSGTPNSPGGAVAVIGTSSNGTHTRFNNIIMGGAIQGLLREGVHTAGGVLSRARLELYRNYPTDSNNVAFFSGITSLLGDPALDIFTHTPDTLYVNNPAVASIGTNAMTLTVTDQSGQPVPDAYVNLVKGAEVFVGGRTNAAGSITLNFVTSSAETLHVTASKHNYKPAINYTLIAGSAQFVSPASSTVTVDDDMSGGSSGNGDGRASSGETIELAVSLRNWGVAPASGVTATLSTSDPFISAIGDNTESYGTIPAGSTAVPFDDFDVTLAGYVPDGYVAQLSLTVTDDASHTWNSALALPLSNANLEYYSHTITGVSDGILDPLESGQIYFILINRGTRTTVANTLAYLRSGHPAVLVTDSVGTFTSAFPNGQCTNSGNRFGLQATARAYPGERVPLSLIFPLNNGFADTVRYDLFIGSVAPNTPTPPDAYGYWAFDNTDLSYPKHPTFNWIEIDPRYGGSGVVLPIVDAADQQDQTAVVTLPFTFRYYGQDFNQIAVCSNGWLAMGADQAIYTDFRNYSIPSPLGPSGMIAPFWDDLWSNPAIAQQQGRERQGLDEGSETCADAILIPSLPFSDTGNTCDNLHECGQASADVFYRYTVPPGGEQITISTCGSSFDTYLWVWSSCCNVEIAHDDDGGGCGLGSAINRFFSPGTIYITVEGWSTSCGAYVLNITHVEPSGVCAYHDAANHRFVLQWSRVQKYNGGGNPEETFQCILYQPGYPPTPTGDGEILFQYLTCNNVPDVGTSNDYATVGIENFDETGGVLYSYYNRTSPQIPGSAGLQNGRAILFTTQKMQPDTPATPQGLTIAPQGSDLRLVWQRVITDIHGNPLTTVEYRIYRSLQPVFSLDGTTYLATVSDTTFSDVGPAQNRYFYAVQASVPVLDSPLSRARNADDAPLFRPESMHRE